MELYRIGDRWASDRGQTGRYGMMSRMAKRSGPRTRDPWNIGMIVVVVAVLAFAGYAAMSAATREDTASYVSTYTPPPMPETPTPPDLKEVGSRLVGTDPFTIAVAGDSTGNADNEWVYLLGNQLVQRGRSVLIHNWSIDTNSYDSERLLGAAEAPRVEIWNGSASGKDSVYSLANWSAMVPVSPDLLFVSHGQNEPDGVALAKNTRRMFGLAQPGDHKGAMVVVLQNPRTDAEASRLESIVKEQRLQFQYSEAALIDVYSAFQASGDVAALVNPIDGLHPNDAGERLWAQTTIDAFGIG